MALNIMSHWSRIRNKINELSLLPREIRQEIYEVTQAIKGAIKKKDQETVLKLRRYRARLFRKESDALKTSQLISKYYHKWKSVLGESSGIGFALTATLGVAAIGALAFVATKGMQTWKEFKTEKKAMEAVKSKALTLEEARKLIVAGKAPKVPTTASVAMNVLNMVPLVLIGGGLWWLNTVWKNH